MSGIELITKEREEQLKKHGCSLEHDINEHIDGELAITAGHLSTYHTSARLELSDFVPSWGEEILDHIGNDDIHRLKVAGALIAAEIDRILAQKALKGEE